MKNYYVLLIIFICTPFLFSQESGMSSVHSGLEYSIIPGVAIYDDCIGYAFNAGISSDIDSLVDVSSSLSDMVLGAYFHYMGFQTDFVTVNGLGGYFLVGYRIHISENVRVIPSFDIGSTYQIMDEGSGFYTYLAAGLSLEYSLSDALYVGIDGRYNNYLGSKEIKNIQASLSASYRL